MGTGPTRWLVCGLAAALLGAAGCGRRAGGPGADLDPQAAAGRVLIDARTCRSCHSTDGRRGAGPTWKGLYGSEVRLRDGRTVTADVPYLRRSVLQPDADVVDGHAPGLMATSVRGAVSEAEADQIVAYLVTLR